VALEQQIFAEFLALYHLEEMQSAEDAAEISEPENPDVADITVLQQVQ